MQACHIIYVHYLVVVFHLPNTLVYPFHYSFIYLSSLQTLFRSLLIKIDYLADAERNLCLEPNGKRYLEIMSRLKRLLNAKEGLKNS